MDADMDELKSEVVESPIDLVEVRKFIEGEKERFDLDRKAAKEARLLANGNSWRDTLTLKTTLKHKVRVDAINQIINKICSKFTSNPFRFIADDKQLPLDYNSYDTAIALAFRDAIVLGQGFIRCDMGGSGKAERLDAGSVMIDSSLNSPYVICAEKQARDPKDISAKDDNLGIGENIIEYNEKTEQLAFVVYRKTQEGIAVARVVNGVIVNSNILPISEYPIIRICAEEAWINNKLSFRGLYYKAMGISDLIDFTFSRVASNILTQPRMKYWVPAALADSEAFHKSMSEMHELDLAYVPYNTYDDQQRPIPPPTRDEGRIFIDELLVVTNKMIEYINMLFGFENAENADTGNKTAQEILFRKENQNANYSQYLFNLSLSVGNVCKIYESLGIQKVSIVSGPYENIYRQTAQQSILAINDYCTANPARALIANLLIKFSSLDEQTKGELNNAIQQQTNVQQIIATNEQAQTQLQQLQNQNQQLMQQNQALRQQQLNSDKAEQVDLALEQMRLKDKATERAIKVSEAEKDRAVELYKIEQNNNPEPLPQGLPNIMPAVMAATDVDPTT